MEGEDLFMKDNISWDKKIVLFVYHKVYNSLSQQDNPWKCKV